MLNISIMVYILMTSGCEVLDYICLSGLMVLAQILDVGSQLCSECSTYFLRKIFSQLKLSGSLQYLKTSQVHFILLENVFKMTLCA